MYDTINRYVYTVKEATEAGIIKSILFPPWRSFDIPRTFTECFVLTNLNSSIFEDAAGLSVEIYLEPHSASEYFFHLHDKDEFYPIKFSLFQIMGRAISTAHIQEGYSDRIYYQVETKRVLHMATDSKICIEEDSEKERLGICLANYIQNKTGCKFDSCRSKAELEAFLNVTDSLSASSERSVYNLTGCAKRCYTEAYDLFLLGGHTIKTELTKNELERDFVKAFFITRSTEINIEKDILLYDGNNAIGDFGGFLGLLLGYSILGLIREAENAIRNKLVKVV